MENISEIFKKAGFKCTPCSQELTPREAEGIKAVENAAKDFLRKIKQAYENSKESMLRFATPLKIASRRDVIKYLLDQNQHE